MSVRDTERETTAMRYAMFADAGDLLRALDRVRA